MKWSGMAGLGLGPILAPLVRTYLADRRHRLEAAGLRPKPKDPRGDIIRANRERFAKKWAEYYGQK